MGHIAPEKFLVQIALKGSGESSEFSKLLHQFFLDPKRKTEYHTLCLCACVVLLWQSGICGRGQGKDK